MKKLTEREVRGDELRHGRLKEHIHLLGWMAFMLTLALLGMIKELLDMLPSRQPVVGALGVGTVLTVWILKFLENVASGKLRQMNAIEFRIAGGEYPKDRVPGLFDRMKKSQAD